LKKRMVLSVTVPFMLLLTFLSFSTPRGPVKAQEPGPYRAFLPLILKPMKLFLPIIRFPELVRFDDFEDADPEWVLMMTKEPKDGYFEHLNGKLVGHIRDNAALMVISPGWRPEGDFQLEVDVRFANSWTIEHRKKSGNGLGLAFGGDDDWSGFYAFLLQDGASQHLWAVVRVVNTRFRYLTEGRWRGDERAYIHDWDGTNHLMVVRQGDEITVYVNGKKFRKGQFTDSSYGPGRLVGLTISSFEFSNGKVEFDNFKLTPLRSRQ